jgi:hypothetical protein
VTGRECGKAMESAAIQTIENIDFGCSWPTYAAAARMAIAIETALQIHICIAIHVHAGKPMTKSSIYRVINL